MATTVQKKPLNTERQTELLRVVEDCFKEFDRRKQTYYSLDGMTTAHVTVHAIQDFTTLKAFWPVDLVQRGSFGQTVYVLEDDTMGKVQSSVRSSLEQLVEKGYVERVGNEHERRWRLIREKKQTKVAVDPDGKRIGTFVKTGDGQWVLEK